ncbi:MULTISPECIES: YaaL family protein [Paenibacillus]|uniref:DUF2508 domain-containing protein n=1 Tax=Paenibacillus cucumis (ex Kampfer et al. 2016) TaxID=1776858 RepID=A0ABS7KN53_9BACL|nr:YaaL family protein [Paenibacillus cucumis (ex Kampfer et al. 2016)]MBY0205613.1 DUF2508 domain-containing protein [Paenibacillus cucumis (ex Kampfer et al. 2016)]MDP9702708.1 hypothetical protein [Paenibacillus intestini]
MLIWRKKRSLRDGKKRELAKLEAELVYVDVQKAKQEWERAMRQFEDALGEDEIDYAIYVLEAAERKYQIHLKRAKRLIGMDVTTTDRGLSV